MLTRLQAHNFKTWRDTGSLRLAPLTGFFGTNSSGKTSLLQLLLMLKQTTESTDRNRVLHVGDDRSLVDLGTFFDLIHHHNTAASFDIQLEWRLSQALKVDDPSSRGALLFNLNQLGFETSIDERNSLLEVARFTYSFADHIFGMSRRVKSPKSDRGQNGTATSRPQYNLLHEGFEAKRTSGRRWPLPHPVKCYAFPDEAFAYYQNTGFLSAFVLAFEELFSQTYYLGPLREYPHRSYVWAGEKPSDVGRRGENAVAALLAGRAEGLKSGRGEGKQRRYKTIEARVLEWLQNMGLVNSFSLEAIAKNRKDYEMRVRSSPKGAEVLITDVGFGVSQILPVLVLCYYVPEGSTIILEQPEIHLHPAVQAGLADVLIDVVNERRLQVIVESHSEHLLRRLQRRIAEEGIASNDTALYFCQRDEEGLSQAEELEVDQYGYIQNWPRGFFGDEMGDLFAMTEAAMERQQVAAHHMENANGSGLSKPAPAHDQQEGE
jgi:predicted ATPase